MKRTYAGMQSPFIPWMGIMQQLIEADVFFVGDNFLFSRDSWVYRNRIKNKNTNEPLWLSVPINKNHDERPIISELKIDHSQKWSKKHLGSIVANYGNSPFFKDYHPMIQRVYMKQYTNLLDLNLEFLKLFMNLLEIDTNKVKLRSSLGVLPEDKNAAIIEMGKKCGATVYLSAVASREYVDEKHFNQNGIEVVFQKFDHPVYSQQGKNFVSHLSTLDALFNIGAQETKKLLLESLKC